MTRLLDAQPVAAQARLAAELKRDVVRKATLVMFDFASGALHWSNRTVGYKDASGQFWEGAGEVVSISQFSGGPDNLSTFVEYGISFRWTDIDGTQISRIPEIFADVSEYQGRKAEMLFQFFDDNGAIGIPVVVNSGLMFRPTYSASIDTLDMRITAENPLLNKRTPPFGDLTSKDQRARHPNDAGLDYVPNAATEAKDWLNS